MPLRIRCPSCRTVNTVEDDQRGQKVRCQECDKPIRIPEGDDAQAAIQPDRKVKVARANDQGDDEDDEPPRSGKRKKVAGKGTSIALLLGGGGVLLLCLCCGGGSLFVILFSKAPLPENRKGPLAQKDRKKVAANKNLKVAVKGKVIFNQGGILTNNDPPDPTPDLKEVNARMKVHQVSMQPGKTYVITMTSNDFDTYLRVESPAGKQLAEDDDSAGDLNARIVFRPTEPGMYRVIATSWDGDVGRYNLKIQEAD